MSLAPTIIEKLARARGDLRMGVPVVLCAEGRAALVVAVEALTAVRLADLRKLGTPELALTSWRAETLKARAYDNDLARIAVPADEDADWLRALADPADDLRLPMKGPLRSLRDGPADLHRAAIALAKSAHLLPAALVLPVVNGAALATAHGLTVIPLEQAGPELARLSPLRVVAAARVPMVAVYRPLAGFAEAAGTLPSTGRACT